MLSFEGIHLFIYFGSQGNLCSNHVYETKSLVNSMRLIKDERKAKAVYRE